MLEIINLTKRFSNKIAINKLNLNIKKGTLYGFIGPNGAGKTTTIKCIAGLMDFNSGCIKINGLNIKKHTKECKSIIGYIPDTPFLYDKLTAREFLFFIGKLYLMDKNEIIDQINRYAEILKFNDYIDIKTEEYSHGMKQRIVIASAFIHKPQLILIDEPMVGLDPNIAKIVKQLFTDFTKKGNTIFLSTHTLSLAEEICNEIGIMNYGQLVYSGIVKELKKRIDKSTLEELFVKITKEEQNV